MRWLFLSMFAACGGWQNPNDGALGQLTISGDEQALPAGRRTELRIQRADIGNYRCSPAGLGPGPSGCYYTGDVTWIRKILEAECGTSCTAFIVDRETVDVLGQQAGSATLKLKAEVSDGSIVEDETLLTFVER